MHTLAAQVMDPVVRWVEHRLGVRINVSDSIFGADQPGETVATVQELLQGGTLGFNQWLQQ